MRRFAVFGGTGFLGRRVVEHLLYAGHRVRIVARRPDRCERLLRHANAEAFQSDILRPETFDGALRAVDGALNAVSLYRETGDLTFDAVHCEAAGQLAAAAGRAGVRRYVQISGIGANAASRDRYIRARGRGEVMVREAFSDAVVVRPCAMCEPDDALMSTIVSAARRLPVYPLFGRGRTCLQPVHVDDVAMACAELLSAARVDEFYEFGGPRVLSYRQLVEEVAAAHGLGVRMMPVPFSVWRALAVASDYLPHAPITPSQVALMQQDNVASADAPGLPTLKIDARDVVAASVREIGQGR